MFRRTRPIVLFFLVCGAFLQMGFASAQAQIKDNGPVNPSSCYSELLQKKEIYENHDELKLAMLSIIDHETFDRIQANSSITAIFKGIPFNAGWDAFKEAREHYFEEKTLNVDHESATFISSVQLDDQATEIFRTCVSGLGTGSYGFASFGAAEDESVATVQLFYKPTDAGSSITILDSTVTNATVEGALPGKLFPAAEHKKTQQAPVSFKDSRTVTLNRTNLNKPIIITLVTKPDVHIAPIRIPKVPERYNCELKPLDHNPKTLAKNYWHDNVPVASTFWSIPHPIDGQVEEVRCDLHGADFIHLDDPSGVGSGQGTNTAVCSGNMNDGPRTVGMTVTWTKAYMVCTIIPWSKVPANAIATLNVDIK